MTYREIAKIIQQDGWVWNRGSGSHRIFKHPTKPGSVIVAYHGSKDIPDGNREEYYEASRNMIMRGYLVIYEQGTDGGWGAYAPDLPGLGVAAETREEVSTLIREGIQIYLDELRSDGLPIPVPVTTAELIEVAA